VRLFTRSTSSGMHHSTSRNEQIQKVPLMTIDEVLKLDQGECIFINPAYKGGREASVPLRLKLKVSNAEVKLQQRSEALWRSTVCNRLTEQLHPQRIPESQLDRAADIRQKRAEALFPLEATAAPAALYRADYFDDAKTDYTEF
jgi:type IV secretion system protein VirD4